MRERLVFGRDQLTERAMNVSELEGTALDFWVARASGLPGAHIEGGICWVMPEEGDDPDWIHALVQLGRWRPYHPALQYQHLS
jgi:hypothetical protein